jgi:X-X-X-Leu-X-X-Gly heptad repeat protein
VNSGVQEVNSGVQEVNSGVQEVNSGVHQTARKKIPLRRSPEEEERDFPPKAPQGAHGRKKPQQVTPEAEGILHYLNQTNHRHYENAQQIQTLLNSGVSVDDCGLVIDFGLAVLRDERPEWYQQYWDNVTPFRPVNFDKYRARAREWDQARRQPQRAKPERLPL